MTCLPTRLSVALFCLLPLMATGRWTSAQEASDTKDSSRVTEVPADDDIQFSRDIQPIFARSCIKCHGGVKQAGDLSFIDFSTVVAPGGYVVEPGKPEESILWERISAEDPEERMPPPEEAVEPLSAREKELIRRWIAAGAPIEAHWSRRPLQPPELPVSEQAKAWSRDPLDFFVWRDLRLAGKKPNREAPPLQWLRRVTFDLIGLPPTKEQIETFMQRVEHAATPLERQRVYEEMVDELLASKHFGERWAAMWLDLARYADSKGFEKDPHRDAWPYRDWLIQAFNNDMPYDQFTVAQLAGDLLPAASYDDLVATAFHRNTQTNTEGGTDDEQFRLEAVIDRVDTTWTVWQGTTFGCVRCHNHPYEPYDQEDYYRCLAIFNNTEDCDLDNDFPTIPYLQRREEQTRFMELRRSIDQLEQSLDEAGRTAAAAASWTPLHITRVESTSGQLGVVNGEVRVVGGTVAVGTTYTVDAAARPLTALKVEILTVSDDPRQWPEQGSVLSHLKVNLVAQDGSTQPVDLAAVIPDYRAGAYDPADSLKNNANGFGGYPKLLRPRWAVFVLKQPLEPGAGATLRFVLENKASVSGNLSTHLRRFRLLGTADDQLTDTVHSQVYRDQVAELAQLRGELAKLKGPRLPILQERTAAARRETRLFVRGNWLDRDKVIEPGLPRIFARPGMPEVRNRLDLARWLVSPDNPLAARVWANRLWSELFGIGLVETLEDFGPSGIAPTHLDLLDHLAYTLQFELGWSTKQFLRKVVLSSTYRQDSRADPELYREDPQNRLLARGPRTRLTAEMIRDLGLRASGLLVQQIGGPSVMPPQPDGVWMQVYSSATWKTATGPDRYRRGVYTYWKRTSPYPEFITFDAPPRDVCSPRRIVTNTPLQALAAMNSETVTEFAAALAERYSELENEQEVSAALYDMFLRVISRPPTQQQLDALRQLYHELASANAGNNVHEGKEGQDGVDRPLSPLGKVALTILNTDWALTK